MTGLQLANFLRVWAEYIIQDPTEGNEPSIPIIFSHQNAPSPDTAYIVINYSPNRSTQGRASRGDIQQDGTTLLVSDWVGTIEIREIYGDGDRLLELVKSLDRTDILDTFFRINGLVHYTTGELFTVPTLTNEHWNRQSIVEITIGIAEGTRDNTSWIDTVGYEGIIGGTV